MTVKEVARFVTSDGSEFESREKADDHELRLNGIGKMSAWLCNSTMYLAGPGDNYEEVAEFLFDNKSTIRAFFEGRSLKSGKQTNDS